MHPPFYAGGGDPAESDGSWVKLPGNSGASSSSGSAESGKTTSSMYCGPWGERHVVAEPLPGDWVYVKTVKAHLKEEKEPFLPFSAGGSMVFATARQKKAQQEYEEKLRELSAPPAPKAICDGAMASSEESLHELVEQIQKLHALALGKVNRTEVLERIRERPREQLEVWEKQLLDEETREADAGSSSDGKTTQMDASDQRPEEPLRKKQTWQRNPKWHARREKRVRTYEASTTLETRMINRANAVAREAFVRYNLDVGDTLFGPEAEANLRNGRTVDALQEVALRREWHLAVVEARLRTRSPGCINRRTY